VSGDGLLQVVTHSTEHRADISLALSTFDISAPGMDYVMYVAENDL
jgi:uncharacterized damage-inducible protein DinB